MKVIINKKGFTQRSLVFFLMVSLLLTVPASSDYELTWHTIDGGGGVSSGGTYTLTGSIGQPDAGYMYGGNYEMLGGFLPGGPLCMVNFYDYARFSKYWMQPCGPGNNFCNGADLDQLGNVDSNDFLLFSDEWLCSCPEGWLLK
jgi:hypothetical protein